MKGSIYQEFPLSLGNRGNFLAGFAAANQQAQQQLNREIAQVQEEAKFDFAPQPRQNPDLIINQEQVAQQRGPRGVPQEQIIEQKPATISDEEVKEVLNLLPSIDELDLEFNGEETEALLQNEILNNPNPVVVQNIMQDMQQRQQLIADVQQRIEHEQGRPVNEEQRRDIVAIIQQLPDGTMAKYIQLGSYVSTAVSGLILAVRRIKKNYQVREDLKDSETKYPINYDTYVPGDLLIGKKHAPQCRRVLFYDEFNRLRSKLVCGNAADPDGQRVYYNQ